ncbi:MAG TPA: hypothetical protein VEH06_01215 [Candidatus Bathyarchaeia archaeon]|nr:hypothetical protein [Candidatus Bathyarchaeia archaeon]
MNWHINPQQQEQSAYAGDFQQEGAHKRLTPESLIYVCYMQASHDRIGINV